MEDERTEKRTEEKMEDEESDSEEVQLVEEIKFRK